MIKHVSAGIIFYDNLVLLAQKCGGKYDGLWEFPGGKLEENENAKDALKRELIEELDINIEIEEFLCTIEYNYDSFVLNMDCFICKLLTDKDDIKLNVHSDYCFIDPKEINKEMLLPADIIVLEKLLEYINNTY